MKSRLTRFGKEVKSRAAKKNITLSEVAKRAGTDITYLSLIMYGRRSGRKYIEKIAEVLDIDTDKYSA